MHRHGIFGGIDGVGAFQSIVLLKPICWEALVKRWDSGVGICAVEVAALDGYGVELLHVEPTAL